MAPHYPHDSHSSCKWLTIGTGLDLTTTNLTLSHLGIESLSDAGADKILFWDDGGTATGWLAVTGTGKGIVTTNLEINSGYVQNTVGASIDFSASDFTQDNTWRTLDLDSGADGVVIPTGAYAVQFKFTIKGGAADRITFRTPGSYPNASFQACQVNAQAIGYDTIMGITAARTIEYIAHVGLTQIDVIITGWFI